GPITRVPKSPVIVAGGFGAAGAATVCPGGVAVWVTVSGAVCGSGSVAVTVSALGTFGLFGVGGVAAGAPAGRAGGERGGGDRAGGGGGAGVAVAVDDGVGEGVGAGEAVRGLIDHGQPVVADEHRTAVVGRAVGDVHRLKPDGAARGRVILQDVQGRRAAVLGDGIGVVICRGHIGHGDENVSGRVLAVLDDPGLRIGYQ